ncbi:MAG: xylulokinase [Acidobacteria bacterium]|nr:MAG: xylulokinase [Acidobacteriota bacterium]PYQ19976.1 MAG: xylulokinase [Acidobacteriota bacterium]
MSDGFLGLDIGTSGVKAVVIDARGAVKASLTTPMALSTPQPGWAEQRPQEWWAAAVASLRRATRAAGRTRVAAVGLSGQMHSSVFLDGRGSVIRPALLWCDGRTSAECREVTARLGEDQLRDWLANPALEGFTLPKVLWLRANEPERFARLDKIVLAKDYVRYRLTGSLATEPSDASGTLMFDTARRRWSEDLMRAVGLPPRLLPELGESSEVLGRVSAGAARLTGLVAGTPVVGGGADNACGAAGVGVVSPGDAVASWGTSGTVLAPTAEPKVDPSLRAHTFCHVVPGTWYVMGVMLSAGGAFAWHRDVMARELKARRDGNLALNDEAQEVPIGAGGVTFLPYLQGERTPHRDASARGAFVGLSLAHTRAHLTRAVIEGICFGLRDSLSIVRGLGLPIDSLLLTGGGARSAFIRRIQAEVYGLPVVRVNREEGPAYGAALLAAVGVGMFPDLATACRATLKRLSPERPRPEAHRAYEEPYRRFQALYPALKSWGTLAARPPDLPRNKVRRSRVAS